MRIGKPQFMPMIVVAAATGMVLMLQFLDKEATNLKLFERLETSTYDWRVKLSTNTVDAIATNRLGNIYVDDATLATLMLKYGYTWPLPRDVYGRVVGELNAQGASVIGFDMLFGELHRRSASPPTELPDGTLQSSDEYFARQMSLHNNVILASTKGIGLPELFRTNALALGDISKPDDIDGVFRKGYAFRDYRAWHPQMRFIADLAMLDLDKAVFKTDRILVPYKIPDETDDTDFPVPLHEGGKIRLEDFPGFESQPGVETFVLPYEDIRVWHLGIQLAARELGLDLDNAVVEPRQIILKGPNGLRRVIPTEQGDHSFYITWKLAWNDHRLEKNGLEFLIDAADARTAGDPEKSVWKDRIVVIGGTGTGQNVSDVGPTPLETKTNLMGTYANVANMLLTDTFTRRASKLTEILLLLFMPFLLLVLRTWFRGIVHSSLALLIGLGYVAAAVLIFNSSNYWLPIVVPVLALVLPQFALVSYEVFFEQNEKRRVKDVFSRLVSPNVVQELLSTEHLNFGGQLKNITVMFSDVRGFTMMTDDYHKRAETFKEQNQTEPDKVKAFSDQMAQESLANVNAYLGVISNMVKKHNGTLDKYMGDCVMAFWGAPTDNDQHALSCVRAAIDSQRAMYKINLERMAENNRRKTLNEERLKSGEEPLDMLLLLALGSGINTGVSIVGLMGSNEHILNYTVFGREVNLASRLEGVSGRGRIVIGENTYHEIKRYAPEFLEDCKPLEPVMVKGISTPVNIYEVPWKENWDELAALKAEAAEVAAPAGEA